jgi:hypothetical protein
MSQATTSGHPLDPPSARRNFLGGLAVGGIGGALATWLGSWSPPPPRLPSACLITRPWITKAICWARIGIVDSGPAGVRLRQHRYSLRGRRASLLPGALGGSERRARGGVYTAVPGGVTRTAAQAGVSGGARSVAAHELGAISRSEQDSGRVYRTTRQSRPSRKTDQTQPDRCGRA